MFSSNGLSVIIFSALMPYREQYNLSDGIPYALHRQTLLLRVNILQSVRLLVIKSPPVRTATVCQPLEHCALCVPLNGPPVLLWKPREPGTFLY